MRASGNFDDQELEDGFFKSYLLYKVRQIYSVSTPVPNKDTISNPDAMKLDVVRCVFVMRCALRRDFVASLPTA